MKTAMLSGTMALQTDLQSLGDIIEPTCPKVVQNVSQENRRSGKREYSY